MANFYGELTAIRVSLRAVRVLLLITSKMLVQNNLCSVLYLVATVFPANRGTKFNNHSLYVTSYISLYNAIIATSCQVYPSEYAYKEDSVGEHESPSANCRSYREGLQENVFTEQYTHCDGTQLKLTDSDLGQEQYQISDYYVWLAGSDAQLLFIFPTRVSLTTITLHYYSESVRGLPRLTFYAVPDDFDVWDAPTTSYPHASVLPGGEPEGRRSISINVNFNTRKVLMYKFSSNTMIKFSVSEVEFFTCTGTVRWLSIIYDQ